MENICAEEEIRTPMPLRALHPECSASTGFATSAITVAVNGVFKKVCGGGDSNSHTLSGATTSK